jgi:hypothetical protein
VRGERGRVAMGFELADRSNRHELQWFADFSLMWIRGTGTFRRMRPKRHRLRLCDRVLQQRRKQRHSCDEPT